MGIIFEITKIESLFLLHHFKIAILMTNEERILLLEEQCPKIEDDFDILHHSINRLPTIALICFSLGLIIGYLL